MANYSIVLRTTLDVTEIQRQIQKIQKELNNTKIDFGGGTAINNIQNLNAELKNANVNIQNVNSSVQDSELSFNAANEIFSKTVDIIASMAEQVLTLDNAMVELRKVSNYSAQDLQSYSEELTELGATVARTGKPKCLSPNVRMINLHLEPFKIQ